MSRTKNPRGFSLLEVLAALGLLAGLLSVTYGFFVSQGEALRSQGRKIVRLQALRTALETLARDIRLAGYPESAGLVRLLRPGWIPAAYLPSRPFQCRPQAAVTVVSGGGLPDGVVILAVLPGETNPTTLAQSVGAGDFVLPLSLSAGEVNDQYRPGDLLVIGQPPEYARITRVTGRELWIDGDPERTGTQGLVRDHPSGAAVAEVSVVSYALFNDQNDPEGNAHAPGLPVLKRKINGGGFEPVAEEIAGLKIRSAGPGLYEVLLEALPEPGGESGAGRISRPWQVTTRSGKRN